MINRFGVVLLAILLTSGCNVFSSLDQPSNEAQYLEAARDCFDQGNFACASKYYALISSSDASYDEATAESAFEVLDQYGVSVVTFAQAISNSGGNIGKLITYVSNQIGSSSGETARLAFFNAFQKGLTIHDSKIQGLTSTMMMLGLLAEVFAEDASSKGNFKQTDLVNDPTACLALQNPVNNAGAATAISNTTVCNRPTGDIIADGTDNGALTSWTASQISEGPTLYLINEILIELAASIDQLVSSSSLASSVKTFTQEVILGSNLIGQPNASAGSPGYRYVLLNLGIGAQ